MQLNVTFHSYFKDLAGCTATAVELAPGSTVADLLGIVHERYPKLAGTQRSTLVAVGVEYQGHDYVLRAGDEVSLFPPVQGG